MHMPRFHHFPFVRWAAMALIVAIGPVAAPAGAQDAPDELKVKRQETFEFAERPQVQRDGDRVVIRFASKARCDATVAIENAAGDIVRHLACGVLGPNAPEPFKKNSLSQTLIWDGKADNGRYVENADALTVRVSLGLQPRFERTLFWSPQKRAGFYYPILRASPEGVYYYEGYAADRLLLFDHAGDYQRTVYPFPADRVDKVAGLEVHRFVENGLNQPLKRGYHQATLLTCGTNTNDKFSAEGFGVSAMDVRGGRMALVHLKLNRLAPDGSTGGLPLGGPDTTILVKRDAGGWGHPECICAPLSVALSPDGKWLYMAGYQFTAGDTRQRSWLNGVVRMPYVGDATPQTFVGNMEPGEKNGGQADGQFRCATSVDCDAKGRVYVSDYMNDRVQVFEADGRHLRNIPVAKPACVRVHRRTGDIYVFSWLLCNRWITTDEIQVQPHMTHFGPLEDPKLKLSCPLPLQGHSSKAGWNFLGGIQHRVELDSWGEKPAIWAVNGSSGGIHYNDDGSFRSLDENWDNAGVEIYEEDEGKLVLRRSFVKDAARAVMRIKPPILWRQRLYVNPSTHHLYVAEGDCGVMKAFNQLVDIDPATGKTGLLDLPLGSEDLCFDQEGLAYLRTDVAVARYDSKTWREVPWDYGEEKENHSYGMGAKSATLASALVTPGHRSFNFWHLGGIDVSVTGHLIVTTCNGAGMGDAAPKWTRGEAHFDYIGAKYTPRIFPGRQRWGEIHIWDKHGRPIAEDVVPGMGHLNGIAIDGDDNIYMLAVARRQIAGQPLDPTLPRDVSGTVVKVAAGKARVLSTGSRVPVPLQADARPKRPGDMVGYTSGWVEGAKWFFGGVGFCVPGGCVCWNCRFDVDYFNRTFAPEPLSYSVAVLDSNGNVILRVGRYGNVDDGRPLISAGGPPTTRSIGGDETALFHACYVASDTDRRLFIADAGNARILSVQLDYHASERVPLHDAPRKTGP
ncbi:MAG: hypothetical protein BIFFINMI_00338 [Phycisphaerae bacterium]|nr:hypothetical protein [Phycisphaerae bacterium]